MTIIGDRTGATIRYFDELAPAYARDLHVSADFTERFALFELRMRDVLRRTTSAAPRSLDIGCGPGTLTIVAATLGFASTGIDGSRRMLELAASAGAGAGLRLDLRHAAVPLPEPLVAELQGSIDLLVVSSVIEYVEDDTEFAAQCRRLLAPGGTALVSFANRRSLYRRLGRLLRAAGIRRPKHDVWRREHAVETARERFAAAGMQTRALTYFGLPPAAYRLLRTPRRPPWLASLYLLELQAAGGYDDVRSTATS